jgi:phosphoenolpyruvate-protein phosphotransferase (PTS system enzyme I)
MSFTLHGVGVSGGIAIGRAHLLAHSIEEVSHYAIAAGDIDQEILRFDSAVATVRDELRSLQRTAPEGAPDEFEAFLNLHLMILNDATLTETPRTLIKDQRCNAEWALKQQTDALFDEFEAIEDAYLRERWVDVMQVAERVLKVLLGRSKPTRIPASTDGQILVAHDLSPADVILFKQQQFAAFITDLGGATSHTAILARSLNIPSIVALHHAWKLIRENEVLIIDGTQGIVLVNPDELIINEYKLKQDQWEIERQKLGRLRATPSVTIDGTPVELHANIELPDDVKAVKQCGATGVGLFRSEFLFLGRDELPGEDEQFEAYRRVAAEMGAQPVTIRTLDVGADKNLNGDEAMGINPALGLRAIRYCLAEPQLFLTQLRAILRASHYGTIQILIPMLSSALEITQALDMVKTAQEQLREANIPYDPTLRIGGMIEVPAAALALSAFVKRLDFLSIGTNDLIQYTLAIDRADDSVAYLYNPLHPAVLQLVAQTIKRAVRANIPVAVCGEMAGEIRLTRLLLGLGLRQFSMHPAQLLGVKQQVLKTNIPELTLLTRKIMLADDSEKVEHLLDRMNA